MTLPTFVPWPKMQRLRQLLVTVTEKIDGTNAMLFVPTDPAEPVLAGSRTRWLVDGADNYGFAAWVREHAAVLRRLGPGTHYGEWYGAGIQRRYGLDHKRFALFNANRWTGRLPEGLPPEVGVVPILYRGPYTHSEVSLAIAGLFGTGSAAVSGWMCPEGVVVQVDGSPAWKLSDNGDKAKGAEFHAQALRDSESR